MSCINPFAPRLDKENSKSSCTDFTNIENLFCAFKNAYAFKDTTLYGSLIDPNFTFSYRDYDRGVDVSWGRDEEIRSTYVLFQNVQSISVIWNTLISADTSETRRSIVRGFNLTVTFNPGDVERVDGFANLIFVRASTSDNWKLLHWRDESNF
ncbi:MAG: hypothetical protein HY964_08885 [Ignavibacteriales bacterium]|nr:hypothetical protein [Ignavibacteriales bacterium]